MKRIKAYIKKLIVDAVVSDYQANGRTYQMLNQHESTSLLLRIKGDKRAA
jgi:hypothetical protein